MQNQIIETKEEPRYLGPCLISTLTLGVIQPPLEEWVPPQGYRDKGWEPRITYRGLTLEQVESFTSAFQMFEEEGGEEEEKGFMLISSLPLFYRSMNMHDHKRNMQCTEACEAKAVEHSTGGIAIHLSKFLEVMDEELRKDAIRRAQGYADRLTDDLKVAAKKASDETKQKLEAEDAEKRKKRAVQDIIAKRRDHYLRKGGSARVAAVRRLVANNDPVGLDTVLDRSNPSAPASSASLDRQSKGSELPVDDPVLTQPLVQSADREGLITLHQLAVERNPRPRGRPPSHPLGDTAAYLDSFPLADELPLQVVPWQRVDPEPVTLSMVRTLKHERDDGFAPFLPPPIYWENRQAAIERGLEHTVMTENTKTSVPMWPIPTAEEEKEINEVRQARMEGRKLIRKSKTAMTSLEAVAITEEDETSINSAQSSMVVKMSLEEKAMAKAKAAEDRARERADQQLAELRRGQDARAWELMRRRSRLKSLQQASLKGRLEHNLKRLGLSFPTKFEKHKSFREVFEPVIDDDGVHQPRPAPPKHPRPPSWRVKRTLKELGKVSSLALAPSTRSMLSQDSSQDSNSKQGRLLAVGRDDEHIAVWDLSKKQRIANYCQQHGPFRFAVPFVLWLPTLQPNSPEAQVHLSFVSGSGDGRIRVFSPFQNKTSSTQIKTGEPSAASGDCGGGWGVVQTVRGHRTAITCAHISFDNQWLATGCAGGLTAGDLLSGTTPVVRVWAFDTLISSQVKPLNSEQKKPLSFKVSTVNEDVPGVDFDLDSFSLQPPKPHAYSEHFEVNQCTALVDSCAVAEGKGHSTSVTSLSWIPTTQTNTDSGKIKRLYHLVSGSRDGEIRQWCCRLQRPDSDSQSQRSVIGSSDPVPPAAASLQVVRVFKCGNMQVSACAFLGFGAMPPMKQPKKSMVKSMSSIENTEKSNEADRPQKVGFETEEAQGGKSDTDSSEEEKSLNDDDSKSFNNSARLDHEDNLSQRAIDIVFGKIIEDVLNKVINKADEMQRMFDLEKEFSDKMVQVMVGDAAGMVNVWSIHLPERTPDEEEDFIRELNLAPSPRQGDEGAGASVRKLAGRRISRKPPAPRCTLVSQFDHCAVRKCFPVDIPETPNSHFNSSTSVLMALSNPFSSSVLDLGALQGAPVVETQSGRCTSWLSGHSGGLMCATGSVLTDSSLHNNKESVGSEEYTDEPFLLTGGGDWSICEWELIV